MPCSHGGGRLTVDDGTEHCMGGSSWRVSVRGVRDSGEVSRTYPREYSSSEFICFLLKLLLLAVYLGRVVSLCVSIHPSPLYTMDVSHVLQEYTDSK